MKGKAMGITSKPVLQRASRSISTGANVIGYLRVSTGDQDLASQKVGIVDYVRKHELPPIRFVSETIGGGVPASERQLGKAVVPQLKKGDILVVSELSRLGRSVLDILSTLKTLSETGVSVHVVKSGQVLDSSLQSKIFSTVMGLAAEIERDLIRQRTKEGQAKAKAAGKHIGRPRLADDADRRSKLDKHADEIKQLAAKGVNKMNLARVFNCDWLTMRNWLSRHEVRIAKSAR
jgi:putative DNA-invertase from lambdoid prophage Rac